MGPIGLARDALRGIGGRWESPWRVVIGSETFALDSVPLDTWAHEVHAAIRQPLWQAAATRRSDMAGLEKGVDRKATNHGWQHPPSRLLAGVIRSVIAGAVWTQDRKYRARMVTSPLCPHCD